VEARNQLSVRRRKAKVSRDNKQQAKDTATPSRRQQNARRLPASAAASIGSQPRRPSIRQRSRGRTSIRQRVQPTAAPEPITAAPLPPATTFAPQFFEEEIFNTEPAPRQPEENVFVDLTPTNIVPSLFQPAQHGGGSRGAQPEGPVIREQHVEHRPAPQPREEKEPHVDLTPAIAPNHFQPAQHSGGSRGGQSQGPIIREQHVEHRPAPQPREEKEPHVDLTPAIAPNHFQPAQHSGGSRGAPRAPLVLRKRPAPRPVQPKPNHEENIHVDLTPTNIIPSLFQSAQFGNPRPNTPIIRQERVGPHTALHRGLESGSRNEAAQFNQLRAHATNEPETPRAPPILTTRRYAYFDESGNYIFGYESEDGSFKEEIRGLDCIVNGKYGYVDPDGVRREFSYVSGNKCDPNDPAGLLAAEGVTIPPNDQFLHQTGSRQMTDEELSHIKFDMDRKNGIIKPQPRIPQQPLQPQPRIPQRPVQQRRQQRPAPSRRVEPAVQKTPETVNEQRFPVPAFLNRGQVQQPRPRPTQAPTTRAPTTRAPPRQPTQQAQPRQQQPRPQHVDLTPAIAPNHFQPAQHGGARGAPQIHNEFNFEHEFRDVFDHFDTRGPFVQPTQRPAPRTAPTHPPTTRRPTTSAPQPRPTQAAPRQIPSLFQPAQHGGSRTPPIDSGSSFTLAPQQSSGFTQLVFDASTGEFKHVQVGNSAPVAPVRHEPVRPAPRHEPVRPAAPVAPGRPLFNPAPARPSVSPLSPIPQSAAEFENFFSNFKG